MKTWKTRLAAAAAGVLVIGGIAWAQSTTTTTFMEMELPVPGVRLGPQWAQDIVDAFEVVDAHDHSTGKGTKVTPAGMNINQDLPMGASAAQANDLTTVRTIRLTSSSIIPVASDRRALYQSSGELHYIDDAGNDVRITLDGSVDTSDSGSITGMGGTDAAVTYSDLTKTFVFTQDTGIPAHGDWGDVCVRDPVSSGKAACFNAPSGLAADYALYLWTALPGAGATHLVTLNSGGQLAANDDPTIESRVTVEGLNPGDTSDTTAGNIRYNGGKLQGREDGRWISLASSDAGMQTNYSISCTGAVATGTTTIPADDTIPTGSEGDEYMSLAYTPKKSGNKLVVEANVAQIQHTAAGERIVGFLNVDAGNAFAVATTQHDTASTARSMLVRGTYTAVDTSSHTFRFRAGGNNAGTTTFNGTVGTRTYGGALSSCIQITEISQ